MSSHQMTERQVLDAVIAEAIKSVFEEYVEQHGLESIAQIFAKGVKIEVGDMLPSEHYESLLKRVPPIWDKAFEVNAAGNRALRRRVWNLFWLDSTPPIASVQAAAARRRDVRS